MISVCDEFPRFRVCARETVVSRPKDTFLQTSETSVSLAQTVILPLIAVIETRDGFYEPRIKHALHVDR